MRKAAYIDFIFLIGRLDLRKTKLGDGSDAWFSENYVTAARHFFHSSSDDQHASLALFSCRRIHLIRFMHMTFAFACLSRGRSSA